MKYSWLVTIALGLAVGIGLGYNSWDTRIFFYLRDDNRQPASIKNVFDFSNLRGVDLKAASKSRILEEASVSLGEEEIQLNLGHFVMLDERGYKTFACREFDRISLVFSAEGIAVSGEPSSMQLEALCASTDDGARVVPISIPVVKILAQKPGNVELQFWDEHKTNIRFSNMTSEWPTQWALKEVKFYSSSNQEKNLIMAKEEIKQILNQPLMLDWSKFSARR